MTKTEIFNFFGIRDLLDFPGKVCGVGITMDIYVHPTIENKRMQMSKAFKGIL